MKVCMPRRHLEEITVQYMSDRAHESVVLTNISGDSNVHPNSGTLDVLIILMS